MSFIKEENRLFPIFVKPDTIQILIVGGGFVACEKLRALLKNDEHAKVKIIAPEIRQEVKALAEGKPTIEFIHKHYEKDDLNGVDIVIGATNRVEVNQEVYRNAKAEHILVNVADTPDLCDFYLGSTVKKGNLKIGISTNGKSPTFSKRLRVILEEILPDSTNEILLNLENIRNHLKGDFEQKMAVLNEVTSTFIHNKKHV